MINHFMFLRFVLVTAIKVVVCYDYFWNQTIVGFIVSGLYEEDVKVIGLEQLVD